MAEAVEACYNPGVAKLAICIRRIS